MESQPSDVLFSLVTFSADTKSNVSFYSALTEIFEVLTPNKAYSENFQTFANHTLTLIDGNAVYNVNQLNNAVNFWLRQEFGNGVGGGS